MKTYEVTCTIRATIPVEAKNMVEAEEKAIEIATSGYFEYGVDSVEAQVMKG